MNIEQKESYTTLLYITPLNRQKSDWNSLNYREESLRNKTIVSIFAMQFNAAKRFII